MSTPKQPLAGEGVDLEVGDIPESADLRAVADILRKVYPEKDAEEIVEHIIRVLDADGL